jgi:chorismate mutase
MSHSSQESKLSQLRETLAQANSELFLTIQERRKICRKIQEFKEQKGPYTHYDPEREKAVFEQFELDLRALTARELLAFSLVMEDQAQAFAPGAYPSWSQKVHLKEASSEIFAMINPLLLKFTHPDIFGKLQLNHDFEFLKDF